MPHVNPTMIDRLGELEQDLLTHRQHAETHAETRAQDAGPPGIPDWMRTPGAETGSEPYGAPSPFERFSSRSEVSAAA